MPKDRRPNWPGGTFVAHPRAPGETFDDLSDDPTACHIVARALARLFDLDFAGVTISGRMLSREGTVCVEVVDFEREPHRYAEFVATFSGTVVVHAREGRDPRSVLKRDMTGLLSREWRRALGLPVDYPCEGAIKMVKDEIILSIDVPW